MGYNILDAIRDEITLCTDAEKLCKKLGVRPLVQMFYREQAYSLRRILKRLEEGNDYYVDFDNKRLDHHKTNRKSDEILERENIALQKAGQSYRIIRELLSNNEKENLE